MRSMTNMKTDHTLQDRAEELIALYAGLDGEALLRPMIETEFPGRIALVSSFGSEAAVLLHIVSTIDKNLPVIFIDTGKMFGETLRYRDRLIAQLGLTGVRSLQPPEGEVAEQDPSGTLWHTNPDACCALRKVRPLENALEGFDAWISGRKHHHSALRAFLPTIEASGKFVKINPIVTWSPERLAAEFASRDLPHHPLEEDGFLSIGCMPCTARVPVGGDMRSGRWAGLDKTECGIHFDI
jgi:phosphoadenosine phosphosulfate reductase